MVGEVLVGAVFPEAVVNGGGGEDEECVAEGVDVGDCVGCGGVVNRGYFGGFGVGVDPCEASLEEDDVVGEFGSFVDVAYVAYALGHGFEAYGGGNCVEAGSVVVDEVEGE